MPDKMIALWLAAPFSVLPRDIDLFPGFPFVRAFIDAFFRVQGDVLVVRRVNEQIERGSPIFLVRPLFQFLALRSLEYTPLPSRGTASMNVSSSLLLSMARVGWLTGRPCMTRFMVRQSLKEV